MVLASTPPAWAFVVNSSTTASDVSPGNGECWTGAMIGGVKECSLYAAILEINATPAGGTITFGVPFVKTDHLPTITKPVVIDGGSQGRAEVRGVLNGYEPTLAIKGGASVLRHVVFGDGVRFETGGGNLIEDCYVGTDPTGTVARYGAGLQIKDSANNTVRNNVVSGNNGIFGVLISGPTSTGNAVVGNFIGTDPSGTLKVSNGINAAGVHIVNAPGNTIGGPNAEDRNVISGTGSGVVIYGATATQNTVEGNLIGTDVGGTTALEELGGIGVTIAGASDNVVQSNVVSGNNNGGVKIEAGNGNQILGNLLGTDADGTHAVTFAGPPDHAQLYGVRITNGSDNVVGMPGNGNTISGNETGVIIEGTSTGNRVEANRIGASINGDAIGNDFSGVILFASGNTVGGLDASAGNLIAYNERNGVGVLGGASVGNAIVGNRIFANGELAIDLGFDGVSANDADDGDSGANGLQNFPELVVVQGVVQGTLATKPGSYRLEFFAVDECDASGHGEAQTLLATTTVATNGAGVATFTPPAPPRGRFLAATAIAIVGGVPGDTSELSACAKEAGTGAPKDAFVVDSVGDEPDLSPGNGACATANGTCTLRAAIQESNVLPKRQTITFAIPGTGPFTIKPGAPGLPVVDRALVIDGTTQPGAGETLAIELDGSDAGPNADGLTFSDGKSVLKGLAINRFGRHGVVLRDKDKNVVQGNYLGTDPTGTVARPNGGDGLYVYSSAKNVIGGPAVNLGNVVSGNLGHGIHVDTGGDKNLILGNEIGTNLAGTAALGNAGNGVLLGLATAKNVIGAGGASANLVSGNGAAGIALDRAAGHQIAGNRIGTNAAGNAKIPNGVGIVLSGATKNTIGEDEVPNVISGNSGGGIRLVDHADENDVVGNLIGTDADGTAPLGNGGPGVGIDGSAENLVQSNTIGDNDFGVGLSGSDARENLIRANTIGTDAERTADLGNRGFGIAILNDAHDNLIGGKSAKFGNVIAGNGGIASGGGVGMLSGVRNAVRANVVYANEPVNLDLGGDGASANDAGDADTGPNTLQNAPILLDAGRAGGKLRVHGRLNSTAGGKFTIDYFLADACPGASGDAALYWKSQKVKTGDDGNVEFTFEAKEKGVPFGAFFAATATDAVGNTSEVSPCVLIAGSP